MSLITLRISDTVTQDMFRLPEGVTLEGAAVERPCGPEGPRVLLLTVDMPDAPPEAASVDITYVRYNGLPDPVQVTGIRYLREDGTEIREARLSRRTPEEASERMRAAGLPDDFIAEMIAGMRA